jgi:hypothetical protein
MKRFAALTVLISTSTWLAVACSESGEGNGLFTGGGGESAAGSSGNGEAGDASDIGGAANGSAGLGGSGATNGSAGLSGSGAANGTGGDSPSLDCGAFEAPCTSGDDCCSGLCDGSTDTCSGSVTKCTTAGSPCGGNTECCTLNCDEVCQESACIPDGDDCTANGDSCCSGICDGGSCKDINGGQECASSGNPCDGNGDCCSGLCGEDGHCVLGSSFCVQKYDICARDEQCCTGVCNKASDEDPTGYCDGAPSVPSSCNTGGIAGTICNSCGFCCSRSCAPYGPTGVFICQLPSGCRLNGELCREDIDCCGGDPDADLPGAGNGDCVIEPGASVGRCGNGNACTPQGDICHYKDSACDDSSTSAPNNCCNYLGNKSNCALDDVFVPRCDALPGCRESGEACSSSTDCCDGRPCIRDEDGHLVCAASECIPQGGVCTATADCCVGTECLIVPGAGSGTCGITDNPPGAGGSTGAGGAPSGGSSGCAEYGQMCGDGVTCCNSDVVPCDDMVCRINPQ